MRPKAVFLDFGGTLAEPIADPLDVWLDLSRALGLGLDRETLKAALAAENAWFQTAVFAYHGRTHEFWPLYDRRILARAGIPNPDPALVAKIEDWFKGVTWNRIYPETHEVLDALRGRGYLLHVISNSTDEVMDRLRELGLMSYFSSVTYSQEAGANKPDPAPFRLALQRAGCEPGDAVHIGNWYEDDVVGARGVGIAPVLVDRDDRRPDADCPRIQDLRGLLGLLE